MYICSSKKVMLKFNLLLLVLFSTVSIVYAQERNLGALLSDRNQYESIPTFAEDGLDLEFPRRFVFDDLPIAGDQGAIGSCTGWAVAYAANTISKSYKLSDGTIREFDSYFSPGYLYGHTKASEDCGLGARMTDVLNFLSFTGVVDYATYPYSDKHCDVPASSLEELAQSGAVKSYGVASKSWPVNEKDLRDIKILLFNEYPVILVIGVPDSFLDWVQERENIVYTETSTTFTGYHAITAVGYDESRNAFLIINSWGEEWGGNGYAWIDYSTFSRIVQETYVLFEG